MGASVRHTSVSPRDPTLRLHHVGHAVQEIEAACQQYRTRFGYSAVSPVIHDPFQTALVQFLRLAPDPMYLELVAPDSAQSRLSAMVQRGGGLHHLCYTAASLPVAIEMLSSTGMRLISDPTPAVAFDGRPICWLMGTDRSLVELVERRDSDDPCTPVSDTTAAGLIQARPTMGQ